MSRHRDNFEDEVDGDEFDEVDDFEDDEDEDEDEPELCEGCGFPEDECECDPYE